MKTYQITVSLSGTYEFFVEAESKEQAEFIAELNPIEPFEVKFWDTTIDIQEKN